MNSDNHYDFYYHYSSKQDPKELFLRKYEARAELSTSKFYARAEPILYRDWVKSGGAWPETEYKREPYVELNIPQQQFDKLVDREDYLTRIERELDYKQRIVNQVQEEERIRRNNESVRRAYEKYRTLLELARHG